MDPDLGTIGDAIAEWAATEPLVETVWLFGSRLRSGYKPNSDLDIAIRLRLPVEEVTEQQLQWQDNFGRWKKRRW